MSLSKQLTALEIASADIFGRVDLEFPEDVHHSPIEAFERVLLEALERERCCITFSGGRDSSALLAVAMRLVRREGLPEPLVLTARFPSSQRSAESEWQQLVIDHLGVRNWEIVKPGFEIELIGDLALDIRRRHGLLYAPNTHFFVPFLGCARGGTLVTGEAGDDLLLGWGARRVADLVSRRRGPRRGDARALLRLVLPRAVRGPLAEAKAVRQPPDYIPDWLNQEARIHLAREQARERVAEPRRWNSWLFWQARWRGRALSRENEAMLASEADVEMVHPFQDPGVIASLARVGGPLGFGDRTATMRILFGDLLPDELLARPTKAFFDEVFWGPQSKEFVREWDGEIGDPRLDELIDADALRRNWMKDRPDFRSSLLLQAARLARD